jgi:periplasmic protein TonB
METKKTNKANLETKKSFFFQTGLVLTLVIVLAAFEWKTFEQNNFLLKNPVPFIEDEIIDVTKDDVVKPEPPKPQTKELIEVDDNTADTNESDLDLEFDPNYYYDHFFNKPELIDEPTTEVEDPFIWVEEMPGFPGGEAELYSFLQDNIHYPRMAVETGIQGTVFVTFIVEKDGSITGINLLKGIGGGCDEEAIRVVKHMPKWKPGKQRTIPVRVQLNLPIKFILE